MLIFSVFLVIQLLENYIICLLLLFSFVIIFFLQSTFFMHSKVLISHIWCYIIFDKVLKLNSKLAIFRKRTDIIKNMSFRYFWKLSILSSFVISFSFLEQLLKFTVLFYLLGALSNSNNFLQPLWSIIPNIIICKQDLG